MRSQRRKGNTFPHSDRRSRKKKVIGERNEGNEGRKEHQKSKEETTEKEEK